MRCACRVIVVFIILEWMFVLMNTSLVQSEAPTWIHTEILLKQVDCIFGDTRNSCRWQESQVFFVTRQNAHEHKYSFVLSSAVFTLRFFWIFSVVGLGLLLLVQHDKNKGYSIIYAFLTDNKTFHFYKGNAWVEISASFFFSFSHSLQVLNTHARKFDSDEHMAWGNGRRRKVYAVEDQQKYCV